MTGNDAAVPDFLEDVGPFRREVVASRMREVNLDGYAPGIHQTEEIIFERGTDGSVAWAVDRACDHAGGKLVLQADGRSAICPLHGWALDTGTLRYTNAQVSKHGLDFVVEGDVLRYARDVHALVPPPRAAASPVKPVMVRFISHACVMIEIGGTRIVTDPWLLGPCFVTGWWHKAPPPEDALEVLNDADLVYISHNHPDHMHVETLRHLRKDMPIVVPDFQTGSTERPVREMGFENVFAAPFNQVFRVPGSEMRLSVLQAGDFRDDSGLWVEGCGFSGLLAVDSNKLNNFVLPTGLDLLMTAFAGGATGFPVCFDVVPDDAKARICARNRNAAKAQAMAYVDAAKPKVFVPYAGFFGELAPEDAAICEMNNKNTSAEIAAAAKAADPSLEAFDPLAKDIFVFEGGKVSASKWEGKRLYEVTPAYTQGYISAFDKQAERWDPAVVEAYFGNARFHDALMLYLEPTTRDFSTPMTGEGFAVDFSGDAPMVRTVPVQEVRHLFGEEKLAGDMRKLFVRVRKASLWHVIEDAMPWEDLSIGFQCRIDRTPDVYNSDFWFYFTNVYIGGAVRAAGRGAGAASLSRRPA